MFVGQNAWLAIFGVFNGSTIDLAVFGKCPNNALEIVNLSVQQHWTVQSFWIRNSEVFSLTPSFSSLQTPPENDPCSKASKITAVLFVIGQTAQSFFLIRIFLQIVSYASLSGRHSVVNSLFYNHLATDFLMLVNNLWVGLWCTTQLVKGMPCISNFVKSLFFSSNPVMSMDDLKCAICDKRAVRIHTIMCFGVLGVLNGLHYH